MLYVAWFIKTYISGEFKVTGHFLGRIDTICEDYDHLFGWVNVQISFCMTNYYIQVVSSILFYFSHEFGSEKLEGCIICWQENRNEKVYNIHSIVASPNIGQDVANKRERKPNRTHYS